VKMFYPSEWATATYGQGLTVTAIQETAAYAAIANGGKLMQPHVVKQVLDPKTHEPVQSFEPTMIRQVVSEATAKKVSGYLEQVVSDKEIGTGRNAAVDGYRVAGKTGTANLVDPGGSGYAEGKWVTSFIGYAPVEDPKLLVTIIAVEPELHGDFHLGSNVAPPAFKEIVSESLRYMGIPTNNQQQDVAQEVESKSVAVPDLTGMSSADAGKKAKETGLTVQSFGKGASIIRQYPAPGTQIGSNERIYVVTQEEGDFSYPNLTGKSLRDALEICSFLHIPCSTTGEGYVTDQATGESNENGVKPLELTLVSASEAAVKAREKKAEEDANKAKKGSTNSRGTTSPTNSANSKNSTNPVKAASSTGSANKTNAANTANRSSKPPAH
ncbi:MAG: stage sporulation protein, partial [Paenibacillaceae bacterium]|nr:stage sporulation protein [Paenibacillaceae bacterium]